MERATCRTFNAAPPSLCLQHGVRRNRGTHSFVYMHCFHQRFDVGLATVPRRPNPGLNDEKILANFDTSDQQEYGSWYWISLRAACGGGNQ